MKDKGIKLLEENMGKHLHDLGIRDRFLNVKRTQKRSIHYKKKKTNDTLNCVKTKNFYSLKDTREEDIHNIDN